MKNLIIYVSRIKQFNSIDWLVYVFWIGMIFSLFILTYSFLYLGYRSGVDFPSYVWLVPIGAFIFTAAIAIDTIGHRTIYKQELQKGEALIHHITIFAGITSVVLLCLGFHFPEFLQIPIIVFIVLSILYSIIDEAFHWIRYVSKHSDTTEMWSHFFILTGHSIMILAWWKWYSEGYIGVSEILKLI